MWVVNLLQVMPESEEDMRSGEVWMCALDRVESLMGLHSDSKIFEVNLLCNRYKSIRIRKFVKDMQK